VATSVGTRSPYRADHVGSLLRPPELLSARQRHDDGLLGQRELRQLEDTAILEALRMQEHAGISVLSDGEYRRVRFHEAWDRALAPFMVTPKQSGSVNPWK
jgi:5-methyltetrahydropteroyltriglutamate--homocysteine methyltransferase